MPLPCAVALTLAIAAQTSSAAPAAPAPASGSVQAPSFAAQERANALSVSLDAGLDLPAAGPWPMASGRLDLRYRLPLGAAAVAEAGLRSGYGYRGFKGAVRDPRYGEDGAAYLKLHAIPVYGMAAVALGTGDESPLLVIPLRLSLYLGAGAQLAVGEAHAYGRTASVLRVAPAAVVGASFEFLQTPSLRYGVFGEWETCRIDPGVPGVPDGASSARFGLTVSYSFGS